MIILCLVEEKIKGQMVKKHILDLENFKHILTAFGDKLTEEDMDDIFGEFEYDDDGNIFTKVTMTIIQRESE
jgi:Ca2+-binding EF-hand superfamily protein